MKSASRAERRDEIMDVAVEILAERGYRDTTMLEVAKRATASKETLYAWFGDKRGLFEAVIQRNAVGVQSVLARHLEDDAPIEQGLSEFGLALLELLLGDSAVAVNRAAIAEARSDPSLAQTLARTGREATLPAFVRFIEGHRDRGGLRMADPNEAAEGFLGLLLGDLQIRRLLGVLPAPKKAEMKARAARAAQAFQQLHAA